MPFLWSCNSLGEETQVDYDGKEVGRSVKEEGCGGVCDVTKLLTLVSFLLFLDAFVGKRFVTRITQSLVTRILGLNQEWFRTVSLLPFCGNNTVAVISLSMLFTTPFMI